MALHGPLNHESVTVAGTAIGITTTAADGILPTAAYITVEDAAIRFTLDGTTPTATVGHLAQPGDAIELVDRAELTGFSAIRQGGTSGTIKVTVGVQHIP